MTNYKEFACKLYYMLAAISKGAGIIPKSEKQVNEFLDIAFTKDQVLYPIRMQGVVEPTEDQLNTINAKLLARFIKYKRNPSDGLDDGSFFVANPDYNIIRLLFNFPEKDWIKVVRKWWQFPSVSLDMKHYIDTAAFESFMDMS